ncbi:hypothetical protein D9M71_661620 [compost metagenome]
MAEPEISSIVAFSFFCMIANEAKSFAGSSLPTTCMGIVRFPSAMSSAARTARASGLTMLRVSSNANKMVNRAATMDVPTIAKYALSYCSPATFEEALAAFWFITINRPKYLARDSEVLSIWPLTREFNRSMLPCLDNSSAWFCKKT